MSISRVTARLGLYAFLALGLGQAATAYADGAGLKAARRVAERAARLPRGTGGDVGATLRKFQDGKNQITLIDVAPARRSIAVKAPNARGMIVSRTFVQDAKNGGKLELKSTHISHKNRSVRTFNGNVVSYDSFSSHTRSGRSETTGRFEKR